MTRDGRKKFEKQIKQQQQQQQQKQQKHNKEKRSRSSDDEGYITEKRHAKTPRETTPPPPTTQNKYDALSADVDLNVVEMAPVTKDRRPPPIMMEKSEGSRAFTKTMVDTFGSSINFRATRNSLQIMTTDSATYNRIKTMLNDSEKRYYTFTEHADKNKSLVIKGIDREISKEEILEDLKSQGLNVIDVYPMAKKIQNKADKTKEPKRIPLDMFQVKFPMDSKIEDVKKVMYVCQYKVTWEKFNKKDTGTQCRNCQRFGHAASNCRMGYRCVKCKDQNHVPGECKKKTREIAPFCVNCGGSHPANYRNCQAYKSYVSRLVPTIPPGFRKVSPVVRPPTNYVRPGVSYAAAATTSPVARPQPTVRPQPTEIPLPQQVPSQGHEDVIGGMFYWFDEMKALFQCTLVELTNKLQVLKPKLESVSSKKDRFTIYMDFLLQCRD